MRVLCTKTTRIEVAPKKYAELDAHHEYYLDAKQARELIAKGLAVELDADGRRVENKPARKAAAPQTAAAEQKPAGPARKPGSRRRTKATRPPENKAAQPGPDPVSEPAKEPEETPAAPPADETEGS